MDNSRCVVLVPVANTIEPDCEAALRVLASRGYAVRTLRGSSQVDLARSTMATRAMRDGYRETLWIDSDTAFNPDDVDRIRRHKTPFCAGLYVRKGVPQFAGKFLPSASPLTFGVGGGLVDMEYVGMGFTLIHADVYRAIAADLPECSGGYDGETVIPYFRPMLVPEDGRHCYLSEDYSFCFRARRKGFVVRADTTIKLGHIGRYTYTWDDLIPRQKAEMLQLTPGSPGVHNEGDSMSAKLYEQIGRKQERIEELDNAYTALLNTFAGVLVGEIEPSRVALNLTDRSWVVSEPGTSPPMPATVNGLPIVVIGKAVEQ